MAKKVDEEWKRQAAEDRDNLASEPMKEDVLPEANLTTFLNGLAAQTLMALGEVENHISNKIERNLPQAKYTIDLLQVLTDKMKGNLTKEEEKYLTTILYDLRMRYVEACR